MITSSSNQQMKNLTQLIKKSKERKNQGVFIVEGPKMVFEAPKEWIRQIYVAESFLAQQENQSRLQDYSYEVLTDSLMKSVSDTQTPQGILAIVQMPKYELADILNQENPQLLLLESVQDPGNLGTMVRTGEGAGITGIIMNQTTVDLFNPKAIRSTMGSIYRVPYYVTEDLLATMQELKDKGVTLYAAHLKGKQSYDEPNYTTSCGFLIGNEGNGLSDEVADLCDTYIRIPMEGRVESLNAAISATLLMYECNRQRRNERENLV